MTSQITCSSIGCFNSSGSLHRPAKYHSRLTTKLLLSVANFAHQWDYVLPFPCRLFPHTDLTQTFDGTYTIVYTATDNGENQVAVVGPTVISGMVVKIIVTGWVWILDSILGSTIRTKIWATTMRRHTNNTEVVLSHRREIFDRWKRLPVCYYGCRCYCRHLCHFLQCSQCYWQRGALTDSSYRKFVLLRDRKGFTLGILELRWLWDGILNEANIGRIYTALLLDEERISQRNNTVRRSI